jgi:hypothetical protein
VPNPKVAASDLRFATTMRGMWFDDCLSEFQDALRSLGRVQSFEPMAPGNDSKAVPRRRIRVDQEVLAQVMGGVVRASALRSRNDGGRGVLPLHGGGLESLV